MQSQATASPAPSRRSPLAARRRRRSLISLTPLIDVVFILLIFYMLASSFTDWHAIPLTLREAPPDSRQAQAVSRQPLAGSVMLDVLPDGLRLSGMLIADAELPARLAALPPPAGGSRSVIVRAAEGVPLQRLVSVMDMLSAAGVTDLSLARRGGR